MTQREELWLSMRATARKADRALSSLQKAIKTGRIPESAIKRGEGGKIIACEWYQTIAAWQDNTDPVQAARTAEPVQAPGNIECTPAEKAGAPGGLFPDAQASTDGQPKPTAGSDSPAGGGPDGGKKDGGYLAERERTERFRAATAELDYLERIGELVAVRDVREAEYERSRVLRDKLLNIPDRIATVVAAICERSDKAPQVHAAIAFELKQVLHELSDFGQAFAAGGVGVREGDPVGDVCGGDPAGPGSDGVAVGGSAPGPVV